MHRTSVLHVEDDDAAAFLLRLALDDIGFTGSVYRVTNGEDALCFLRKSEGYQNASTPRLVILDLNIPKRDGWAVLAERKSDPVLKQIPIVILTTAPAHLNEQQAIDSGVVRYMEKGRNFEAVVKQAEIIVGLVESSDTSNLTFSAAV
jgi:CheY-like chemotaxis protein